MADNTANATKKQIADNIIKTLNPHFSALLGSNIGYGVSADSASMMQDLNAALKQWFTNNNSDKLVALLRTAQVTNVITESELNGYLDAISAAK